METVHQLDEEERQDTELRSRFKEKWTRQPSSKLTDNLRKEVSEGRGFWENLSECTERERERERESKMR